MPRRFYAGLLILAAPSLASGIYMPRDLVDVPVERIVVNLEARLVTSPNDAALYHALARAHAIAYAQGAPSIQLERSRSRPQAPPDERQLADGGFPPRIVSRSGGSSRHLDQAVARYRTARHLDPKSLTIALGYGWALEQSAQEAAALAQYRDVLRRAIEQEQFAIASEAGTYLKRVLPASLPASERADVEKTLADLEKKAAAAEKARADSDARSGPRPITPIVIPLVADAPFDALVSRRAAVSFDLDGSGESRRWQWITPQAGWLVYQGNGDRRVDSGIRLLGSRTFWIFWKDGYHAMTALDDDGDDWLSGAELAGLAIWRDADSNGVTDIGEVRPLGEWGIVALSCAAIAHREGFPFSPRGVVLADGSVRPSYDWIATSAADTLARRLAPPAARYGSR